jgi:hypothetical protein
MTSPISLTRLQIEAAWLSKVKAAQRRYRAAAAQHDEVLKNPLGRTPDAALTVWEAALEEIGARREYLHVLNTFTRLVVDGEVPPEG